MKIQSDKIGLNFWKVHPQLKLVGKFKEFYEKDKTKDKEKSSSVMWAIFLIYDSDSEVFNFDLKEKISLVSKDFLSFTFKEEDYKEIRDFYLTPPNERPKIVYSDDLGSEIMVALGSLGPVAEGALPVLEQFASAPQFPVVAKDDAKKAIEKIRPKPSSATP